MAPHHPVAHGRLSLLDPPQQLSQSSVWGLLVYGGQPSCRGPRLSRRWRGGWSAAWGLG
jgi:hypothetical protein